MKMDPSRMFKPLPSPNATDWRKHVRPVLLVVVPALVILACLGFWLRGGRYVSTDNAYVKADIAQVAAEIAGRIAEVKIRDHAQVKAGDVLVVLDKEPFRLALAKAEAEVGSARAVVNAIKMSLKEAESELVEAVNRQTYLETQAKRQRDLAVRGVSPATKLEQADSDAQQARDRTLALRQKVERVKAQLNGQPDLDIDAYATVREKLAMRDRAALDLTYTEIKSPVGGIAVNLKLQPGEQVKAQTALFALVAERRPWVEANFKETDLTNVTPGQKASVVLDIYPDIVWEAEVDTISPATGAEFAILPPQNASGNWVKVVQRLPVKLKLVSRPGEPVLRAGMTASVSIDTERRRSLGSLIGWGSAAAQKR
jgi:membrane fusion protein (multidrug efflux system)